VIAARVRKTARIILCVAAAGMVAFYLRRMPFAEIMRSLRSAQPLPLVFAALVYLGPNTAAKVRRWASLLAALPRRGKGLGTFELARVLFASQAASNLLPARAGEAVRIVELHRRGYGTTGLVAAQLYGATRLARPLHFARSAAWAHSFLWSCAADLADAAVLGLCLHAVGADLAPGAWLVVLLAINVAILVPSTPGHVGVMEAAALAALLALGVPAERALAGAVLYHAIQIVPGTAVGLLSLPRLRRSLA